MKVLVVAEGPRKDDLLAGPLANIHPTVVGPGEGWEHLRFSEFDFVVHATLDETPYDLDVLESAKFVFGSTVLTSYQEFAERPGFVGFNGLPYFIGLNAWEVVARNDDDFVSASALLGASGISARRVHAGVGMVAPRVLFPIINEAYRTAAEGTASRQDVETSMRLGVNYPFGPFEWAEKIGVENVAAVLGALAKEYGPQYLPVPALKYAR